MGTPGLPAILRDAAKEAAPQDEEALSAPHTVVIASAAKQSIFDLAMPRHGLLRRSRSSQ